MTDTRQVVAFNWQDTSSFPKGGPPKQVYAAPFGVSCVNPIYAVEWMQQFQCVGSTDKECLGCAHLHCPAHGAFRWSIGLTLLITGGRTYNNRSRVFDILDCIDRTYASMKPLLDTWITPVGYIGCIVQGQCRTGADRWAREWARDNLRHCPSIYAANWDEAERLYGNRKLAGPIRNKKMVDSKPDMCLYFPGGAGTTNTVNLAKKAGIPIVCAAQLGIR